MKKLSLLFALCALSLASLHAADITITAANVLPSGQAKFTTFPAASAVTAGQLLYCATTCAQAVATSGSNTHVVAGIAINSAATGQQVKVCYYDPAFKVGGTVAVGAAYILSSNAGGLAPSADAGSGWYVTFVGIGIDSTHIKLDLLPANAIKP
jgi:hypothetical protein